MDATEFRRASHAVWEAMAAGLDDRYAWFEETTRPVTERMLERLVPAPAHTILDLAAGVGVGGLAAAALVGPDGRVIVSDFSEAMVAVAARHARGLGVENAEFRVLDAERIELADDAVDGVLCRWGWDLRARRSGAPARALRASRLLGAADRRGPVHVAVRRRRRLLGLPDRLRRGACGRDRASRAGRAGARTPQDHRAGGALRRRRRGRAARPVARRVGVVARRYAVSRARPDLPRA
jgi:methyltransferase family protein